MEQFTEEQAIAFGEAGLWRELTDRQRAELQMHQERMCMPFDEFHASVEATLGRPVQTIEFAFNRDGLLAELAGDVDAQPPSLEDLLNMIPKEQRALVLVGSLEEEKDGDER